MVAWPRVRVVEALVGVPPVVAAEPAVLVVDLRGGMDSAIKRRYAAAQKSECTILHGAANASARLRAEDDLDQQLGRVEVVDRPDVVLVPERVQIVVHNLESGVEVTASKREVRGGR